MSDRQRSSADQAHWSSASYTLAVYFLR